MPDQYDDWLKTNKTASGLGRTDGNTYFGRRAQWEREREQAQLEEARIAAAKAEAEKKRIAKERAMLKRLERAKKKYKAGPKGMKIAIPPREYFTRSPIPDGLLPSRFKWLKKGCKVRSTEYVSSDYDTGTVEKVVLGRLKSYINRFPESFDDMLVYTSAGEVDAAIRKSMIYLWVSVRYDAIFNNLGVMMASPRVETCSSNLLEPAGPDLRPKSGVEVTLPTGDKVTLSRLKSAWDTIPNEALTVQDIAMENYYTSGSRLRDYGAPLRSSTALPDSAELRRGMTVLVAGDPRDPYFGEPGVIVDIVGPDPNKMGGSIVRLVAIDRRGEPKRLTRTTRDLEFYGGSVPLEILEEVKRLSTKDDRVAKAKGRRGGFVFRKEPPPVKPVYEEQLVDPRRFELDTGDEPVGPALVDPARFELDEGD